MKKREKEVKEGKQKKGKKKRDGEEYIPIKPMIGEAPDYHIYMMDRNEKAAAFFIGYLHFHIDFVADDLPRG